MRIGSSIFLIAVGAILAWAGLSNLKTSRLAPRRTAEQIRRDAHFIKERIQ